MTSLDDVTNNGNDVDSTQISGKFPEDEGALIDLFKAKNDGLPPNIPVSADGKPVHWTEADFVMDKGENLGEGKTGDGQWWNPGRSWEEGKDNPPPWPGKENQENQTPSDTWLWYGERLVGKELNDKGNHPEDKQTDNPWTQHNFSLFRLEFDALFAITPESFCVTEDGSQIATARFQVDFDGPLSSRKEFSYVLSADNAEGEFEVVSKDLKAYNQEGEVENGVDLGGSIGNKSGTFTVAKGVEYFEWKASFKKTNGELTGDETVTLNLRHGNGQQAGVITIDEKTTERLDVEKCFPPGDPLELKGEAACPDKTDPTRAVFAWTATLDPNYGDESEYGYVFDVDGLQKDGYTIKSTDVSGGDYQSTEKGKGVITVVEGVSEVSIAIEVVAETKLSGKESATLTLTGGKGTNGGSVTTDNPVSISGNNCAPGNIVEIKGDGVCRPDQKTAAFIYTVSVDANYGESQSYRYEFAGENGGFEQGYEFSDLVITVPEGGAVRYQADEDASKGERGEFVVGEGVKTFEVTVLATAEKKLTGKEKLSLEVGGVKSDEVGITGVSDCAEGAIKEVEGDGVCRPDQKTAAFIYTVSVDANYGESQSYRYEFAGENGGFEQGYEFSDLVITVPEGGAVRYQADEDASKGERGEFVVGEGVKTFEVTVLATAEKKLTGKEKLSLEVGGVKSDEVGITGVSDCAEGAIKEVEGDGVCRPDQKTAAFIYTVSVDANYGESQSYRYEFAGENGGFEQGYEFSDLVITVPEGGAVRYQADEDASKGERGEFVVGEGVKTFEVTVLATAEKKLTGKEKLSLEVGGVKSDEVGITGVSDCAEGAIKEVEGDGVCRPDQKTAAFIYTVSVDANYGESQSYRYEFAGENGGFEQGYEFSDLVITVPEGGAVRYQADEDASKGERGEFVVGEGVKTFEVTVLATAEKKLTGKEKLSLEVGGVKSDEVGITGVSDCAEGAIKEVEGDGVCRPGNRRAVYTYVVEVDPNYGSDQIYEYEFIGSKGELADQGFVLVGNAQIDVLEGDDESDVVVADGSKGEVSGEVAVGKGVKRFAVTVVLEADEKLTGNERLQLKVGDVESDAVGLKELENCVTPGFVEEVIAEGVCLADGSAKNAEFTFVVKLSAASNQNQEYFYEFSGNKDAGDYELIGLSVVYGESVSPVEPGRGKAGSFVLPEEVSGEFSVLATIRAEEKLTGDEAITLTIDNQELSSKKLHPTDTAVIKNFDDCVYDPPSFRLSGHAACLTTELPFALNFDNERLDEREDIAGEVSQDIGAVNELIDENRVDEFDPLQENIDDISLEEPEGIEDDDSQEVEEEEVAEEGDQDVVVVQARRRALSREGDAEAADDSGLSEDANDGGESADDLDGGDDDDVLEGGKGSDELDGGSGDDGLEGGKGADDLDGGSGDDDLDGGSGSDLLEGGKGSDLLNGGSGIDFLDGGTGNDTLVGGAGADDFLISLGRDVIKDFNPDVDNILLPEPPVLSPGQMPAFTQEGDHVVIRDQYFETVIENSKLADVLKVTKANIAIFIYNIVVEFGGESELVFDYEFSSPQTLLDGYQINQVSADSPDLSSHDWQKQGSFILQRPENGKQRQRIRLEVEVEALEAMNGDEALTLTLSNSLSKQNTLSETASLRLDQCDSEPPQPPVIEIEPSGACVEDGRSKTGIFRFDVSLSGTQGQESQDYAYLFEGNKRLADGYEVTAFYINGEAQPVPDREGVFSLPPSSAGADFTVEVEIAAESKLDGDEALRLTLDSVDQFDPDSSPTAVAKIENFDDCAIDGLVTGIDAEGACIDDGNAKVALFTFNVELSGAYNKETQRYFYKFESNKALGDGYTVDQVWVNGIEIKTPAPEGGFELPQETAAGSDIQVQVTADEKLDGKEALKLTLDNQPLNERSFSATAKIENFDDCAIDGLVTGIDAEGACIDDGNAKVALFTFNVELSGAYNKETQRYFYKFESNKALGDGYTVDQVWVNGIEIKTPAPEGGFELPQETAAGSDIQVQVQVTADEKLDGKEALKLTLDNQPLNERSFSATAKIENFDDCAIDGLVTGIDAEGACIDDGNAKVALFTFNVELSGAYNKETQRYFYKFESNKALGDGYTVDQVWVNGIEIKTPAPEGGFELPQETAAGSDIQVQVQVTADEKLDGKEALKLTLDNQPLNERSFSATAKIENFDDCAIDGLVTGIDAEGACIDDGNAKVALFTFNVELSGAYDKETQRYFYKFESNKALGDGYTVDQVWVNGIEIKTPAPEGGFELPQETAAGSDIQVQVQVTADEKLDGKEALKLTLDNQPLNERSFSATAKIKNFDDCTIDGLVKGIKAKAACVEDGNANKATFAFEVVLNSGYNNRGQVFSYRFDSNKALDAGYEVTAFFVNGEKQDLPAKQGSFELPEKSFNAVTKLDIQVDVQANGQLDGTESLTLMLDNTASPAGLSDDSPSATAVIDNFDDCPPSLDETSDVALYLVLDNSTSMLLPDPSTTAANRKDRLEAQDRVALHSFEKGIRGAGYGFSRKGENSVLSSEQFRQALVNNGTQSLSEVLDGFDVIVNPDFDGQANAVTVHLITYGYAVEYGTLSFDQSSTDEAIKVAKRILDVKTPDQLYGNSIEGNSTWGERDLPQPDQNDLFQGEGRPSSNLYSGTEMLGALLGLEHLLKAQAKTRGASDLTTLVSMVTDGRPERRAWWDTRTGAGSDSLTGFSVPLPEPLGGDAITSSGLIYDQEGNATYLENNAGKKQWKKMQRKLNKALDAIAAKSSNPAELALQVEVMAMGEGTDADFPAIYEDLFGKRTFDNSDGGWSYQVFNSFADLPDFFG